MSAYNKQILLEKVNIDFIYFFTAGHFFFYDWNDCLSRATGASFGRMFLVADAPWRAGIYSELTKWCPIVRQLADGHDNEYKKSFL